MPRRVNFSEAVIAERFLMCGGRCEGTHEGKRCNVLLKPGGYHADHDHPGRAGGKHTVDNCRILCVPCHIRKYPADAKKVAQTRHWEAMATGADRVAKRQRRSKLSGQPKDRPPLTKIAQGKTRLQRMADQ